MVKYHPPLDLGSIGTMPIRGAGFVSFRGVCAKMVDNVTFLDVSMVSYDSYVSQNAVKVKLNIC